MPRASGRLHAVLAVPILLAAVSLNAQSASTRIKSKDVKAALSADGRSLIIDPLGVNVPVPTGQVEMDSPNPGLIKLKVSHGDTHYRVELLIDSWNCELAEQMIVKAIGDPSHGAKDFQKRSNADFDPRWYPAVYSFKIDGQPRTNLCLDTPSAAISMNLIQTKVNEAEQSQVAAFAKALADAFPVTGSASQIAFQQVTGNPGSIKVSLEWVYPRALMEGAMACKTRSNSKAGQNYSRVNCIYVESLERLHQYCATGYSRSPSAEACNAVADQAGKDKDHMIAAIYYQAACDQGDKKSCGRAMESKQKSGR
jgi:hypothetical protein